MMPQMMQMYQMMMMASQMAQQGMSAFILQSVLALKP
jgi:hypothetical protein